MWKIVSDPERPKNDKVTILSDAIQMLKDLTAQINTLKAEYNSLSEESHEVNSIDMELLCKFDTVSANVYIKVLLLFL